MRKARRPVYDDRTTLHVLMERTEYEAFRRLALRYSTPMSGLARKALLDLIKKYGEHQ